MSLAKAINGNVRDHIKEVMNIAGKTYRAKITVPKSLLRNYMLELKLMGVAVTVENENELYINWSEESIKKEMGKRGSSEQLLRSAARISGNEGKGNKQN